MNGLLGIEDPKTAGLLSLGLRLMSTPGNFGTALGKSGLGAMEDVYRQAQVTRESQRRDRLTKIEEEQLAMQRAKAQAQAQAEQQRNAYLASVAGQMGPPEPVNAAAGLMNGLDPQALAMLMQQPKEKAPIKLGAGEGLYDPQTFKPLAIHEKPAEMSAFEKTLVAAGMTPGTPEFTRMMQAYAMKQATHAPAASATIINKQEGEEAKAVGKAFGEQYGDIQKAGMGSQATTARLDQMQRLLDGVNTGKLAPAGKEVAAWAQSVGINLDPSLGNKQAVEALSNEMALELRNPSGGAGMPGALSDQDRKFLQGMTPSLSKTPEGNRMIIEARRKLAQRSQEVAKLARKYRQRKGTIDEGFFDELEEFSNKNQLFGAPVSGGKGQSAPSVSNW